MKINDVTLQYREHLLINKSVLSYLSTRGVERTSIDKYGIGYCPAFINNSHPMLRGRIVVPIHDVHDNFIAFAGRIFEPAESDVISGMWANSHNDALTTEYIKKWKQAKWWNETYAKKMHLHNLNIAKESIRDNNYVIIVEGYFDVIVLGALGLDNVVSLSSARLSIQQCAKLKRYTDNVVFLLDGDDAGKRGTEASMEVVRDAEMVPFALSLPKDSDPDTFVIENGNSKITKSINYLIDNNKTFGEFYKQDNKLKLINIK